jgi:hypothetical protein
VRSCQSSGFRFRRGGDSYITEFVKKVSVSSKSHYCSCTMPTVIFISEFEKSLVAIFHTDQLFVIFPINCSTFH